MTYRFLCHALLGAEPEVREHYDNSSAAVQAGLDAALGYLRILRRDKWTQPRNYAARLDKQKWPEFYEVRFLADKLQQRPIGFFGPGNNDFTLVIWCTEKGGSLVPSSWFKTANNRRLSILDGSATAKPLYGDDHE